MTVNPNPVERIYPDDKRVKPQTIAHHKARYELATTVRFIEKGLRSLDLGSGTGYGAERLREAGYLATGVEIDAGAVDYSRKHYPKVNFIHAPVEKIFWGVLGGDTYDLITFFEVIEHLTKENAEKVLANASSVLGKKGVFVMSVPRDTNPKNNGFHKSEWPFKELKATLESKFELVELLGQDWDTAEFSDKDVDINDFYIAICKNG